MKKQSDSYLECCLYFTANSLARNINRITDEEFMITGLSPSHAFLQMLVNEKPGITQQELGGLMNLAPSTITRFIDKLATRKLVFRKTDGKLSKVHPTEEGSKLDASIREAWKNLYESYCKVLGEEFAVKLTADILDANRKFEETE